jgi:hypothetical protein
MSKETKAEKYFQSKNGGKPSKDSEMITAKWGVIMMEDFSAQENKELIEFIINIGYKKQLDIELELQKKGQSNYRKSKKQ